MNRFYSHRMKLLLLAIPLLGIQSAIAENMPAALSEFLDAHASESGPLSTPAEAYAAGAFQSPIVEEDLAIQSDYLHQRCKSFYGSAYVLYSLYLSFPGQPISPENATTFAFAWNVSAHNVFTSVNLPPYDSSLEMGQIYMNTYGNLHFPDTIRDNPIFISDKQTCVKYFETIND